MKITGTTRVLGIIGDPVSHSRTSQMQNQALAGRVSSMFNRTVAKASELAEQYGKLFPMIRLDVRRTLPSLLAECDLLLNTTSKDVVCALPTGLACLLHRENVRSLSGPVLPRGRDS